MTKYQSISLLAAVCSLCWLQPCMSAETSDVAVSPDSTTVIDSHLSRLTDSPYTRALRSCFQEKLVAGQLFNLPALVDNPELILLIACSSSMETDEKQYWFDVYPELTQEQKERLYDMLSTALQREVDPTLNELRKLNQTMQQDAKTDNVQQ